jgi:hypothetical protein
MLRRLIMLDCKSISTPMIPKLKKLQAQATGSDPEDLIIIGSLIYIIHTIVLKTGLTGTGTGRFDRFDG